MISNNPTINCWGIFDKKAYKDILIWPIRNRIANQNLCKTLIGSQNCSIQTKCGWHNTFQGPFCIVTVSALRSLLHQAISHNMIAALVAKNLK